MYLEHKNQPLRATNQPAKPPAFFMMKLFKPKVVFDWA